MKKFILICVSLLTLSNMITAQTDTASRKAKLPSFQTPPRNPIPPVDLSSAPKDANYFEISITKNGVINGKGILSNGVKGCTNCNVAGKLINPPPGNSTIPTEEESTARMHKPIVITKEISAVSSTGKKTPIKVDADGSWSANLPAGVYTLSALVDGKEMTIAKNIHVK